jgi:predicted aminopeptidase
MAPLESYRFSALARKIPVIALTVILALSGCRFTYILHAASNQFRLMHNSIDVEDVLREDLLETDHKRRLQMVDGIKDFGEKELCLKKTQSYQTVYLESSQPLVYTISASPKDGLSRISWWFPIVGDMPYLGFFDLKKAEKEKEKLVNKGLDVSIGVAVAYSTLGWFKDPLTLNLLGKSTVELTETILHEMTHSTLYIKDQGEFNEGLANIVGKVGALSFMKMSFGDTHSFTIEAENNIADEQMFSSFLVSLLENLEQLYSSDITYEEKLVQREKIFTASLDEFDDIRKKFKTDRFNSFGKYGLNNAYLMSIALYHRHFKQFESVLIQNNKSICDMLSYFRKRTNEDTEMLRMIEALPSPKE